MRDWFSRGMLRRGLKRHFQRNCSSGAKTTDEKAAEVSKDAWPSLRKYSPIWVPALLLTILTVDVVNNTNHRNTIEPVVPALIEFIRKYVGFDDEDPIEIKRVKETIKAQEESVSALIELSSGRNIIEENVDGKLSYGDFYQLMKERWGSEGSINKISFLDTSNNIHDEDEEAFNNNVNGDENTIVSMKNNHRVPYMINSPLRRTLWENDNGECVPSSSSRVISLTDVMSDLKPPVKNNNQQSVWSTAMFGLQKSEQDNRPLNKAMMVSKFESIVSTVLSDWNHFQSIENPNILVIHGEPSDSFSNNQGGQSIGKDKQKQKQSSNRSKMSKLMEVEEAKMTILSLEGRIADLKTEKKHGTREIDQVDSEISNMKNEITKLKRQYLNYFYFF